MSEDCRELARKLVPAVLAAGRHILAVRDCGLSIVEKPDGSPVTQADRGAEDILLAALGASYTEVPVVAEEQVSGGQVPQVGTRYFLVDPLDGTKEFVAGREAFTVNVGLVDSGVPVFGIVLAPATSELFLTLGASCAVQVDVDVAYNDSFEVIEDKVREISTRLPQAPDGPSGAHRRDMNGKPIVVTSLSHGSAAVEQWVARVGDHKRIHVGSSLKFLMLASGQADIYPRLGRTHEWDTAAGDAILRAAGGVTLLEDCVTPLVYGNAPGTFVNPPIVAWRDGDDPVREKMATRHTG